jgi:hypothetical protein
MNCAYSSCYDLSFLHMLNLVAQFVMIYILVLIWKLPKFSTLTTHTHTFF